ncbi:sigma-70 family RNA polymerase sigma factor [Rubritalea sp.]|uniref:sigma-70 family RNA polymerase sigma factor n=1 Tax=Rubritalea sp. TaxID=2109375 RepID=UPI003EF64308
MDATRHTLIQRLKDQNDEQAWETFTETYASYIAVVLVKVGIPRHDLNDLKQDVLLKLWQKLPDFEYNATKGKFRSWLWLVIRNTAYNHLSSKLKQEQRVELYFTKDGCTNNELSPELEALMQEEWKAFITLQAMDSLRGKFAEQNIEIFRESLKGTSSEELAERFGVKRNTVNRVVSRIKERLVIEIARLRQDLE